MAIATGLLALRANLTAFGLPVAYRSADGFVEFDESAGHVGLPLKSPVPIDSDAENTSSIQQFRDVLRVELSIFPDGHEPGQGDRVVVGGVPSVVIDARQDPQGFVDLPLGEAPP